MLTCAKPKPVAIRKNRALSLRDASSAYPSSSEGDGSLLEVSAQITHTIGQAGASCAHLLHLSIPFTLCCILILVPATSSTIEAEVWTLRNLVFGGATTGQDLEQSIQAYSLTRVIRQATPGLHCWHRSAEPFCEPRCSPQQTCQTVHPAPGLQLLSSPLPLQGE